MKTILMVIMSLLICANVVIFAGVAVLAVDANQPYITECIFKDDGEMECLEINA